MKKLLSTLLCASMLFTFGACTAQEQPSSSSESTSSEESSTSQSSDESSEAEPVTLRFCALEADEATLKPLVETYMEENPHVTVELVLQSDFTVANTNVLAAHQASDDFDLLTINHVDTLAFVQGGILYNLDEFISADGVVYEDVIFESQLASGQVNGSQYSIPVNTDTRVLAINNDLFTQYDVPVPTTIDEMLEAAKALTVDGNFGFVNAVTRNAYVSTYEQGVFLLSLGGRLYEMDGTKAVATIDTPEMREYLEFNVELLNYMPKNSLTMTEDEGRAAFYSGNIGMYIYGPWEFGYSSEADFDLQTILIPAGTESASTSGGYQYGIGAGTQNPDAAWDLFKYITTSTENLVKAAGASLPTAKDGNSLAPFNEEKYQVFFEQMATSKLPQVPVANLGKVVDTFHNDCWLPVLYGDISVDDACTTMQPIIQELLDENNE